MTAARARRGSERLQGNIEARGESQRMHVYAGPDPVAGKPAYLRETVRGTDDAARRTVPRTLNRLVPKRHSGDLDPAVVRTRGGASVARSKGLIDGSIDLAARPPQRGT
ncbi:MAG: hypothetical protein ACT4NP_11400 [Pseudonocardiales bacterium]